MQQDLYIERIVQKKKTSAEYLLGFMLVTSAIFLCFAIVIVPIIFGQNVIYFSGLAVCGIGYLAYRLVNNSNKEYEYSLVNDDMTIDQITAKRKRTTLFQGSCKDFTMVAPVDSDEYQEAVKASGLFLDFRSGENALSGWFFVTTKSSNRMLILFEPDDRFIVAFRRYIPRYVKVPK